MSSDLVVDELRVRYGAVAAVRGLSFCCGSGDLVAILGPNGAGKSSTLLAIAGALRNGRAEGAARFGAMNLLKSSAADISRAGVSLVPERRHIFNTLTTRENLVIGASGWARRREAERYTKTVIERLPSLEPLLDRPAGLLSGGQQQQVAIARALMARPQLLLLDEPSLGLAPQVVDAVFDIINGIRADGVSIVLVEQAAARALEVADFALVMTKGKVSDSLDHRDADSLLTAYLGGTSSAPTQ